MPTSSRGSRPFPRSVSEWFRQRCRPLPLLLSASLLASGFPAKPMFAAEPDMTPSWVAQPGKHPRTPPLPPQSAKKDAEGVEAPAIEPQVKLNYTAATWEKVLQEVAQETGSVLIADRVPSGRFTRRDKAKYSRGDAVRIINREIEPLGFRLVEKGPYLIVMDLPSLRPRYEAPTVPRPTNQHLSVEQHEAPVTPQRNFSQVKPVPRNQDHAAQPGSSRSNIQLMSHEEPAAPKRHILDPDAEAANETPTVAVFRPRHQTVNDLAKRTYRTFKDRAELLDAGRNNLPAFRAHKTTILSSPVLFTMSIDEEHGELIIDAKTSQAEALLKLLSRLDSPDVDANPIQLVSSTRTVCELGPQLPGELAKIRNALAKQEAQRGIAVAQANAQPVPQPGDPPMPTTVQEAISSIRSEVGIEAIPDLGVLILKGNQKDVDAMMDLIRQLEKLSEATAPQVHLLFLQNVDSSALAELLTTVFESLTKFPGKATQPRQNVAIVPVVTPNAILIVAPASDMQSILDLADQLDSKVDPESEFQVFPLKSGVAARVAEKLTAMFEEPTGLGARPIIQADERSNSIIVRAKPSDLDQIGAMITAIDKEFTERVSKVKIIYLKNAVATEISAVINAAIQGALSPPSNQGASQIFGQQFGGGAGQIPEEFRDVASPVLQMYGVGPDGDKKLRSGILADIRITPDPRMNALMVAAPEASLALVEELVNALDQPSSMVAEIKVFTLANADATTMVQQLQGLFNAQVTGGTQGQFGANQQRQQLGVLIEGAEDAGSGLIPMRFSIDTRTNSVIAIGSADALRVVEAIMLRLDGDDARGRKNSVYRLKNSPATNVAQSITTFLTNQQQLGGQLDQQLISTVEQLEREVIVVAEPVSNSLLISATPRYYEDTMSLIKKLDEPPQQVIMQALIVEVDLQDTDEFGVELGFQDSILFDRSLVDAANTYTTTTVIQDSNGQQVQQTNIISQAGTPGFLFANPATPLGNNTAGTNTNAVGTQGLSNFSLGRVNGDLGFGGLVLSASSESVSMLLRALAQNRQVRVLSRPQVRAMDNQTALVQQGQNVPVVRGVSLTGTGSANPQIDRDDAGVILEVTPRISPDGTIVMAIRAEKSQYQLGAGTGVPIFTDANTGNVVEAPVKDISVAQTTISVPNGQTVVLGGLITSRTDNIHRRVPWLGDIPVIGWAFRYDFVQTRRTELLIFLTPRIITDDAYSEQIKEVEMARIHFIECEAEEMHGPLRGIPSEQLFEGEMPSPGSSLPTYTTPGPMMPAPTPVVPTPMPKTTPPPPAPGTGEAAAPTKAVPEEPAPPQPPIVDPQFIPATGEEQSASLDRRVIHAARPRPDRPSSLRIDKSSTSNAATDVRLGKDTEQKKSWFSFTRK